jgi:hypothetical protein
MLSTVLLLVVSLVGPTNGLAEPHATNASPQDRQEILDYQLTLPRANQLITAMEAMTRYVVSLPDLEVL